MCWQSVILKADIVQTYLVYVTLSNWPNPYQVQYWHKNVYILPCHRSIVLAFPWFVKSMTFSLQYDWLWFNTQHEYYISILQGPIWQIILKLAQDMQ